MDFIKGWTLSVCVTVVVAVIFSFFTPKGSMGKFFKITISLFIGLSFFYPFAEFGLPDFKISEFDIVGEAENNTDRIISDMVCDKVKTVLREQDIVGADVDCSITIDEDNTVTIDSVQVAVSAEYDRRNVEQLIYDELNIVAKVIYIGQ